MPSYSCRRLEVNRVRKGWRLVALVALLPSVVSARKHRQQNSFLSSTARYDPLLSSGTVRQRRAFYESRHAKWSATDLYVRCLLPLGKHFELDPYY